MAAATREPKYLDHNIPKAKLNFKISKVKSKPANQKAICDFIFDAILIFVQSIAFLEIFTAEICMKRTLIFRMCHGQMQM